MTLSGQEIRSTCCAIIFTKKNAGNIALELSLMGFGWTKEEIEKQIKGFSVFNNDVRARNVFLDELIKTIKVDKSKKKMMHLLNL